MAINNSVEVRNARLDAIETAIGASPILRIYSGAKPTATTDAATGTLLAEMALPSDWLAAASGGVKAKSGTWNDLSANNSGVAGYYRIWNNAGTVTHMQGTVTETGGGGDMELDNTDINATQNVTVTAFSITAGNA